MVSRKYVITLRVLLVMIIGLMALGAGVRTMNAGLACPDWPLCFGKVIPDFHVGVYFEFIHRAYAGLVSLVFFGVCFYAFRSPAVPASAKWFAGLGIFTLLFQIIMGGLTVLKLLSFSVVTSHLMLATIFFCCVLWMLMTSDPAVQSKGFSPPAYLRWLSVLLPFIVFGQIFLGGLVASSYAGMVCLDFPTCNGQWVPTWEGPIGIQVIHRFGAYFVAFSIFLVATLMHFQRESEWMTKQVRFLALMMMGLISLQIVIGILNLKFFIPPSITVAHQSVAVILLAVCFRMMHVMRVLSVVEEKEVMVKSRDMAATAGARV